MHEHVERFNTGCIPRESKSLAPKHLQPSSPNMTSCRVMSHHAGKGKQDVALFKEAASIFHHNDLRTFPLCQRDELTPAGGSVNVLMNR